MKKILPSLMAVAFLSVAARALAADVKPDNSTVQQGTSTTSEAELEKIHSAPAKKAAKKQAKPAAEAAGGASTTSEAELEKIHSAPAKKDAPAPAPAK